MSRILAGIVVALFAVTTARAETVDWSQYIEKNPPARATPAATPKATTNVRAKREARPTKTVASKPKAKPPAKTKPRRK